MRSKKLFIFAGLLLSIFLISMVSAESCTVRQTNCLGGEFKVIGLSSNSNAHGQLANYPSAYDYMLCCDFGGGDAACNGSNKIVGLSSATNAHAEIPSLNNYGFDVCYGGLYCSKRDNNCNLGELTILSLSGDTNAHLGGAEEFNTKICCLGVCDGGKDYIEGECVIEQVAYWADSGGSFIDEANVVIDTSYVLSVVINTGLAEGTEVTFEIYEVDLLLDDLIKTKTGTVDSNGDVEIQWTVTQEDLNATGEPTNFDNFYFKANGETSNELTINIVEVGPAVTLCMNYDTEELCEGDPYGVANHSVEVNNPGLVCGETNLNADGCEIWISCECEWMNNSCGPKKVNHITENCPEGYENPSTIGSCFDYEDTTDNCDDGFLTYSWTGSWTWGGDNNFYTDPGLEGYIQNGEGIWHYDPDNKSGDCTSGGSNIVSCPAQIKLPFFGFYNMLITAILMGLVYAVRFFRKES